MIIRQYVRPMEFRAYGSPKVIRRAAEVCPSCGAEENFRVLSTQRRNGQIFRYSVCRLCGAKVLRVVSVRPKGA